MFNNFGIIEMKRFFVLFFVAISISLISCGEKFDELKNAAEVIKNAPDAIEEMGEQVNLAEKRREERVAKGDTLALHFSELQKYLPESLPGLNAQEPNGQSTNITGFSMSTVEREYTADDESGRRVRISLVDYNESYEMFTGVAYWASLNLSTETSDGFSRTIQTSNKGISGFEEYSKSSQSAKIYYALGYRFLLMVEENGAKDFDFVKDVIKKIDMEKLAKM